MEMMENKDSYRELVKKQNASDHLANERTLLAWIRTSIGIMAFGFVVVKFSLFIKQISLVLGKQAAIPNYGYSGPIGILLVIVGAISMVLSLLKYKKTEQQLNAGIYYHASWLLYLIVGLIFIVSIFLVAYLLKTSI